MIDGQIFANRSMKARAVPHQSAHICYGRSLSHFSALGTCSRILPSCCGFTCQAALVDLEISGGENAEIGGNAVARDEGDKITRDSLICEKM